MLRAMPLRVLAMSKMDRRTILRETGLLKRVETTFSCSLLVVKGAMLLRGSSESMSAANGVVVENRKRV